MEPRRKIGHMYLILQFVIVHRIKLVDDVRAFLVEGVCPAIQNLEGARDHVAILLSISLNAVAFLQGVPFLCGALVSVIRSHRAPVATHSGSALE